MLKWIFVFKRRFGELNIKQCSSDFFQSVQPMQNYKLRITTLPGEEILFDFTSRLSTTRFADLKNKELFESVSTDGANIIFAIPGWMPLQISVGEFFELLAKRTFCISSNAERGAL